MSISDIRKNAVDGLMANVAEINKTEIRKVNQTIARLMAEGYWDQFIEFHRTLHDIFMEYCLDDAPVPPPLDVDTTNESYNKVVAYMIKLNRYAISTIYTINTAFIKTKEIGLMVECRNKILSACIEAMKPSIRGNEADAVILDELEETHENEETPENE